MSGCRSRLCRSLLSPHAPSKLPGRQQPAGDPRGIRLRAERVLRETTGDSLARQQWGTLVLVAAIATLGGALGTLSEQSALQRRQATQVAPVVFVIELLVPIGLAVTVVGEDWSSSPA